MGGNVVNEGWKKPHSFQKRYKRCRSKCRYTRQQKWKKRRRQQQWHKCERGRTYNHIDLRALLRPVNINGKRAPGMRAPRNTTQFLMHEKYQELKKQAADCPSYWQEEGDGMIGYLFYLDHSRGGLEQTNTESLKSGEHGQLSQSVPEQYSSAEKDVDRTETFLKRNFEDMYNGLEDNVNSEI
ncbi:uncharacterized protein wu:fb55g09 [Heterodontus francisci]|uniref:uncharacterized protein wu:fb55g09 n=1 Tax=Heterodontus francisci TaxID=7792 RepID=UPI00355BB687